MNDGEQELRNWEVAVIEGDYTRVVSVRAHGYDVSEQSVLTFYCLEKPLIVGRVQQLPPSVTVLCLAPGMWRYFKLAQEVGEMAPVGAAMGETRG